MAVASRVPGLDSVPHIHDALEPRKAALLGHHCRWVGQDELTQEQGWPSARYDVCPSEKGKKCERDTGELCEEEIVLGRASTARRAGRSGATRAGGGRRPSSRGLAGAEAPGLQTLVESVVKRSPEHSYGGLD